MEFSFFVYFCLNSLDDKIPLFIFILFSFFWLLSIHIHVRCCFFFLFFSFCLQVITTSDWYFLLSCLVIFFLYSFFHQRTYFCEYNELKQSIYLIVVCHVKNFIIILFFISVLFSSFLGNNINLKCMLVCLCIFCRDIFVHKRSSKEDE